MSAPLQSITCSSFSEFQEISVRNRTASVLATSGGLESYLVDGVCALRRNTHAWRSRRMLEHAKQCWALAAEATNPALKQSLTDIAQRWARLASDLETTCDLIEKWGEQPNKMIG